MSINGGYIMFKFNLQLFAEEEMESGGLGGNEDFIEDEEVEEELEDEEFEEEEEEEIEEDEDEEEDPDDKKVDKKTKAIIKHKKAAQLEKQRADDLQAKLEAKEIEEEETKRVRELEAQGKTPAEAKSTAKDEAETKKMMVRLTAMELNKLESSYPGISNYSKELLEAKEKLPDFSYEQIYLAKFSKQSEFDRRTKLEQEMVYKQKKSRNKSLDSSNVRGKKSITLSQDEQATFEFLKRRKPGMTKKKFKELMEADTLE